MRKNISICLVLLICLGLSGCKSSSYSDAIKLEESKDYYSAATIYEELGEYKDSGEHLKYCNTMIDLIEKYNTAKVIVEEKNIELDNAISAAETLILEKEPALDETLIPVLETAVSEAKAEKQSIPEMPETENEINSVNDILNKIDYSEVLSNLSDKQTALEQSIKQYALVNAPNEAYIIECLKKVKNVIDISAATEDNDPNGHLNKAGGYTAQVYFSSDLINQDEIDGITIIDKGTDCGGSIEVYSSVEDANNRNDYLALLDGGIFASGSHTVVGTVLVRTSNELTASQQKEMETDIIAALTDIEK
ncbi:MAG: hypothetical protein NC489_23345 [Ruminococcus flavefaciens]|nr:hypothetical protein [Ruminococcus flavefaciens]